MFFIATEKDSSFDEENDPLSDVQSSCLYHMAIPEKFVRRPYGELFEYLCEQNILALGLYRLP